MAVDYIELVNKSVVYADGEDTYDINMQCRVYPSDVEGKALLKVYGYWHSRTYGSSGGVSIHLAQGNTTIADTGSNWNSVEVDASFAGKTITMSCNWGELGTAAFTCPPPAYKVRYTASQGIQSVAINRTTSATQLTDTGALTADSWVYLGDVIQVTATAQSGYSISSGTGTFTVSTVSTTYTYNIIATLVTYLLSITSDEHITLTVEANGQVLRNGDRIVHGTQVSVNAVAATGYEVKTMSIIMGGNQVSSPVTVTGNLQVTATSSPMATATIGNDKYLIYINDGTGFSLYQAYIHDGSSWNPYY